ncbi:MAG: hypothetical protein ACN4GT_02280 [Gammaproteobacteria bacterium]
MNADRSLDALKRSGLHVVRFLSTIAMDPHLYFEQKLSAEIRASESIDELGERLAQLVAWIDGLGLQPGQLRKLDTELEAEGLPSLATLRRGDR